MEVKNSIYNLGGGNSHIFFKSFSPILGEDEAIFDAYVSNGLVQPTNYLEDHPSS